MVAAVARLFAENGYGATTISDIARAAGVAVQTVYSAVGGKPALIGAVVSRAIARRREPNPAAGPALARQLRKETDPRRRIPADELTAIAPRVAPVWLAMRAAADSWIWTTPPPLACEQARALVAAADAEASYMTPIEVPRVGAFLPSITERLAD